MNIYNNSQRKYTVGTGNDLIEILPGRFTEIADDKQAKELIEKFGPELSKGPIGHKEAPAAVDTSEKDAEIERLKAELAGLKKLADASSGAPVVPESETEDSKSKAEKPKSTAAKGK